MSKLVTTKAMAKVAGVATGLAMIAGALTFAQVADAATLTSTQIQSILSLLSSFGASAATIANVSAALNGQPTTTTTTTTSTSCTFTGSLTIGSRGVQVTCLQDALIAAGYSIPAGATGYFGAQTQAAVAAWQKANGVMPAAGYFGPISQAHWNLGGSSSSTTTTTTGTVGIGSGNGLEVSLSPTSPSGTVLVQGQGIGDLADYTFANPTTSTISVTGLTFNRIGVSNDSTINNVYLYNGVTRITDSAGVSNSQFSFNNAAGIFTVAPGTSVTISVRADIATGTSGQQLGASLVSVASSGTLASTDSFPINSGYQTISAANLATVQFSSTTLPSGSPTISPQSSYTVWQNSVSVSTNPVWLKSMTFTNLGSIDQSDIGNFRLYVDGIQAGNAVASLNSNRQVVFDLSANPVELSTQSHVIKVLADVTGGASLTFELSVQRSSDALFIDSQLNQPVTPTVSGSSNFTAVSSSQVTVQAVSGSTGISVSKDPASPSNAIASGATSIPLASFDMLASGEPVKVMDLYVYASTTGANSGSGVNNGKIFVNGVQVGSTRDIAEGSTTPTDFSLGSSLILPAGQTTVVTIYGDAQNSAGTNIGNNGSITIGLAAETSNAQGEDSLQTAGVPYGTSVVSSVNGNTITVSTSALTASKYSGYANQTIIPGSQNALIGEFTLSAGSTEGVNVNTIGIDASSTWNQYLQNMRLVNMSSGQQIGTTLSTPSSGTNSFSLGTPISIPQSGSVTVGVYANLLSTAASVTGLTTLGVDSSGTTGTGAVTNNSVTLGNGVVLQTITPNTGSLTVSLGASNPVAANVIAGASSLEAGDFTFNANYSSYTIQKLEVDVPNATAAALTSVGLKYTDVNGATQTASLSGPTSVGTATTTYQFTGLTAYVASNSQSDISVWVGTPTIANAGASVSGLKIAVTLDGGQNFQAQDQSGSLTTTFGSFVAGTGISSNATTGYGTLVVRKSIPTYTMLTNPSSSPQAGSSIYQFSISADPAGPIDVDQIGFSISTSTTALGNLKLYDITSGSAVQVGAAGGVGASATGYVNFALGSTTQQIGAGQSKTYELVPSIVSAWATGDSVTIALAQDTAYHANTDADTNEDLGYYQVWSDRSAQSHTSDTSDYTNGYLLKNFVNDVTSYVHS